MSCGSLSASPHTPGRDRWFPGMLLSPYTFRLWVSHQIQRYTSNLSPLSGGYENCATWRRRLKRVTSFRSPVLWLPPPSCWRHLYIGRPFLINGSPHYLGFSPLLVLALWQPRAGVPAERSRRW